MFTCDVDYLLTMLSANSVECLPANFFAASPSVYLRLIGTDAETTHLEVIAEPNEGHRRGLQDRVLGLLRPPRCLGHDSLADHLIGDTPIGMPERCGLPRNIGQSALEQFLL